MKRWLPTGRPSPAMVVAFIALCVGVTGGAFAAATIDSGDIVNGSITKKDLHKNSVNTKKVKNKTLKAVDFAPGQLEQGVQGIPGLKGEKGEKGEKGDKGDTGARGPSDLYAPPTAPSFLASDHLCGGSCRELPRGSQGVAIQRRWRPRTGSCNIFAPDPTKADTGFTENVPAGFEGTPVAQSAAIDVTATTTVSLTCSGGGLTYGRMQLQVLQVETIH